MKALGQFRSIRVRMTLVFMLILAPFLLLTSHLVIYSHRLSQAESAKRRSQRIVENAKTILDRRDWKSGLTDLFSSDAAKDLDIGAIAIDGKGNVLWRSPKYSPSTEDLHTSSVLQIQKGDYSIYVGLAGTALDERPDLTILFTLIAAAILAFCVAAWLSIGRTLSPIQALAKQAEAARAEEAGNRLVSPSKDVEMCDLVATLNGFLDRIEEVSEEKGRFYAAASHELRTPLQALQGHLEVSLSQARTAKEYRATIQEAYGQTRRLTSLVEGILLLHHLQGRVPVGLEPVCVSAVVQELFESFQPLIEARNLRSEVHVEGGLAIESVPAHVGILVRNLLENSAKYGREGGLFSVNLTRSAGGTLLRVANEIAADADLDAERLFEPFYRREASRSTKSGGNGLGLAICRSLAKANGWSLTLSQENGAIVAEVVFA